MPSRIPPRNQAAKRKKWLEGLQLEENAVTGATRVCSKHFWNGILCVTLGKNMSKHVDPTKCRRLVCTPLSPAPSASTQTKSSTPSSTHSRQCSIVLPCRKNASCPGQQQVWNLPTVWKVMTPSFAITQDFLPSECLEHFMHFSGHLGNR